jgi:hypothetical protein
VTKDFWLPPEFFSSIIAQSFLGHCPKFFNHPMDDHLISTIDLTTKFF